MLAADNPPLIDQSKSVKRGYRELFSLKGCCNSPVLFILQRCVCDSDRLSEFQCVICLLTCTNLCLSLVKSSI